MQSMHKSAKFPSNVPSLFVSYQKVPSRIWTTSLVIEGKWGFIDYSYDKSNNIFSVVREYNNDVKMLSNHQDLEPTRKVKRWGKQKKYQVSSEQPKCVAYYNFMAGEDKMDWLINKCKIRVREKKWYFPLSTNIIDMTVINAHVLFCMANWLMPLLEFKWRIVRVYMPVIPVWCEPVSPVWFTRVASNRRIWRQSICYSFSQEYYHSW